MNELTLSTDIRQIELEIRGKHHEERTGRTSKEF